MIKKIFTRKSEPTPTLELADQTQMMLDILKSDLALGKVTEKEYAELCRTVNDGVLEKAEQMLEELERGVCNEDKN